MSDAYASLYEHNPAGTPLALGVAGVYSKWVTSTVGLAGPIDLLLPSAVNDEITVEANGAQICYVSLAASLSSNRVAGVILGTIFINGVAEDPSTFHITTSNVNDKDAGAGQCACSLAVGDVIDARFNSTVLNTTLTIYHVSLVIQALTRAL